MGKQIKFTQIRNHLACVQCVFWVFFFPFWYSTEKKNWCLNKGTNWKRIDLNKLEKNEWKIRNLPEKSGYLKNSEWFNKFDKLKKFGKFRKNKKKQKFWRKIIELHGFWKRFTCWANENNFVIAKHCWLLNCVSDGKEC